MLVINTLVVIRYTIEHRQKYRIVNKKLNQNVESKYSVD